MFLWLRTMVTAFAERPINGTQTSKYRPDVWPCHTVPGILAITSNVSLNVYGRGGAQYYQALNDDKKCALSISYEFKTRLGHSGNCKSIVTTPPHGSLLSGSRSHALLVMECYYSFCTSKIHSLAEWWHYFSFCTLFDRFVTYITCISVQ